MGHPRTQNNITNHSIKILSLRERRRTNVLAEKPAEMLVLHVNFENCGTSASREEY